MRSKVEEVLKEADSYHAAYYKSESFSGPSLHFHIRSLETRRNEDWRQHLELVYATLASWGMHRMGRGGSKMVPFDTFFGSVACVHKEIVQLQLVDSSRLTKGDAMEWQLLETIFKRLKVMQSRTSLVGNSKVMAHMIPDLVPPMDREYTLRFLCGSTNIKNDLEHEWRVMRQLLTDFFIPLVTDGCLQQKTKAWMARGSYPWDTSPMKVADNLIIGAVRLNRKAG
jgi:hypothetical protein